MHREEMDRKTEEFLDVLLSEFDLSEKEKIAFRLLYRQGFVDGYFAKEHELKIDISRSKIN